LLILTDWPTLANVGESERDSLSFSPSLSFSFAFSHIRLHPIYSNSHIRLQQNSPPTGARKREMERGRVGDEFGRERKLQHTATHGNTLRHPAKSALSFSKRIEGVGGECGRVGKKERELFSPHRESWRPMWEGWKERDG